MPKNQAYNYIETKTTTKILIEDVVRPEGPIKIRRYDPNKGEGQADAKSANISAPMIARYANAIRPDVPLNIDRVLGGSYNTRSAFEALLAHTPEFYYCYPGRIEASTSSINIKEGHKHLLWRPNSPHKQGVMTEVTTEIVISEVPTVETVYEALVVPEKSLEAGMDIDTARRHAQIQIALVEIGRHLGFRTWVAQNDKGIKYKGKKLGELEGVIGKLDDESLLSAYREAVRAALLIDCIWFRNAKFMPAVIEIEHSTGITSGLTRMKTFQDALPPYPTRWVIAAADEEREKFMRECSKAQFQSLKAQFFPYSAIEELHYLCHRRKISGVSDEFLDCFMERCLTPIEGSVVK